jgi:catechol 1,2-dioxygenase
VHAKKRKPISKQTVMLDVWLTASDRTYEGQEERAQEPGNLRGRFETGEDGAYQIYAIRPTAYSIPQDGTAGRVLEMLDRHAWRPAHVHFLVWKFSLSFAALFSCWMMNAYGT